MLLEEEEFRTRYPAAYEALFGHRSSSGLSLPSLNTRVIRNDPQASVLPPGWIFDSGESQDSGDAFSSTFEQKVEGSLVQVDQEFLPLDLGYLRGALLAILSREEYTERIDPSFRNKALLEGQDAAGQSYVRITDLRLAMGVEVHAGVLRKKLEPLLKSLQTPITTDRVIEWKSRILNHPLDQQGQRSTEEEAKAILVSFAAAALLLFIDFNMPGLRNAKLFRLTEQIVSLAQIVRTLLKNLDTAAGKSEKLLTNRSAGRQPHNLGSDFYNALVAYRMGEELKKLAGSLGVTVYASSPSEPGGDDWGGTKHWRTNLRHKLSLGREVEEKKYPLAAIIFANKDKVHVQRKARRAYYAYLEEERLRSSDEQSPWPGIGRRIRIDISTHWGLEVAWAYIQLGSCIEHRIDPIPN